MLDDAALEMAQRASPLPAIPRERDRAALERVVPVQFMLN